MDCSKEPSNLGKFGDETLRAYQEYLATPTIIILGFILLALFMAVLEQAQVPSIERVRDILATFVFGEVSSTREILISSAATLITITSITFTVLLLAVQQAAAAMSTQIIDQFLRRPVNQFLFGYFVGMSIYTMIVLAAVRPGFNPVLSTTLSFVFAGIALYFLAALVYITLTQMRSGIVIHAIHDETIKARVRLLPLLTHTRRTPQLEGGHTGSVRSRGDGYISFIDLHRIAKALPARRARVEILLKVCIGSYVAHGDEVAVVRTLDHLDTEPLGEAILRALKLSRARDLQNDPGHGVEQIMNIGWVSISSAQHSPSAGAHAIHALRDLLSSWTACAPPEPRSDALPIVYQDDVPLLPLHAIESLAAAAVESRQHQSFGHVLQALVAMFDRLPHPVRAEAEGMILRLLPGLENQLFTTTLDNALASVAEKLEANGSMTAAQSVRRARRTERREVARKALEGESGGEPVVRAERIGGR